MSTQQTPRKLFRGGTVVTMDANVPNLETGDVLVEDSRIIAVGSGLNADDAEIIDARNAIVLPGLVDAHHHAWLAVMRRMMPDVDDLFAYIAVVAERLGSAYRPQDMYQSTKLTAVASLDAGITTIVDACHNSRSPEHTDAALDALDAAGIRALHMVGKPMDKRASPVHLPHDLERLAVARNGSDDDDLVHVGLFGQLDLEAWAAARRLGVRILTEFIGDLAKLGPEFAAKGVLGTDNIFNHCTRMPQEAWKLLADAGVNVTVNPRSDALFGFDDESFAYQQAIDYGLTPALGIDIDTAFGSDMFGEMHTLFSQQRSAMRYRRFRGEAEVAAPITVEAVLQAATVNGARAAGLERSIGTLTPGKQADIIMVRADGIGVFPATNAIGTIVQAVGRSDVDTVMVAGEFRKRGGKLIDVDTAKLLADVAASRDFLFGTTGYLPGRFESSAAAQNSAA